MNTFLLYVFFFQAEDGIRDIEQWQRSQNCQPFFRRLCITGAGLVQNELGDAKLKLFSPCSPPFLGQLLMAGNDEVPARPCREVTGYRCFEVNTLRHGARYSMTRLPPAVAVMKSAVLGAR